MLDIPRGNPTFSMRRDEADAAWSWIEPILDAWERAKARHKAYTVGIWSVGTAIAPIARDGRTRHEDIV
jgi:glucose-6-phosphate 1-dehydrogenase